MLTVGEALEAVREAAGRLPASVRPLADALGSILDEDVAADIDSPPFDKALVDGYAVRTCDLEQSPRRLAIGEVVTAGRTPSRPLAPGEAAVVMTGAPVPAGCDAVVMHEKTRAEKGSVVIDEPTVRPGQNLMPRGKETRAGSIVLTRGSVLNPARLGVLATVGRTTARVISRPRIAIVSTGDELVEPGQLPGPGQIRDSNAIMLHALAAESNGDPRLQPIAPDEPNALRVALSAALSRCDLLLLSGGVSAGQRDLVPEVLEGLGVRRVFHQVRLKPGKPLWFGVGPSSQPDWPGPLVFGLPGNPVSVLVGFLLFVKPALRALLGRPDGWETTRPARLLRGFSHRGDRPTYHPVRLIREFTAAGEELLVDPLAWSGSADLCGVAQADGFAAFEAGARDYGPGEIVGFLPMR
jgi:molybdopterin molybdotransferase